MPRHRLHDQAIDDLGADRVGGPPHRSPGPGAPHDHTRGTKEADGDQATEDGGHLARRYRALLEPLPDQIVGDQADHHRRRHGAGSENSRARDGDEEGAFVVVEQGAHEPERLHHSTALLRNVHTLPHDEGSTTRYVTNAVE